VRYRTSGHVSDSNCPFNKINRCIFLKNASRIRSASTIDTGCNGHSVYSGHFIHCSLRIFQFVSFRLSGRFGFPGLSAFRAFRLSDPSGFSRLSGRFEQKKRSSWPPFDLIAHYIYERFLEVINIVIEFIDVCALTCKLGNIQ
jgi:hypothetical protein